MNLFNIGMEFRLYDVNIKDNKCIGGIFDEQNENDKFQIQLFGINEIKEDASILVNGFKPFFYVFLENVVHNVNIMNIKSYFHDKIDKKYHDKIKMSLVKKQKLYGFTNHQYYSFLYFEFDNMTAYYVTKNLFYLKKEEEKKLIQLWYFENRKKIKLILYETSIPPLLRFYHLQDITPSGWISIENENAMIEDEETLKKTYCRHEITIDYDKIQPLHHKETIVPLKIMSYDIEADSSHGDFPIPIKTYKKVVVQLLSVIKKNNIQKKEQLKIFLKSALLHIFQLEKNESYHHDYLIDIVYTKKKINMNDFLEKFESWISKDINEFNNNNNNNFDFEQLLKEEMKRKDVDVEETNEDEEEEKEKEIIQIHPFFEKNQISMKTILDIFLDEDLKREELIYLINMSLCSLFPKVQGDKVTFIGSSFRYHNEKEIYKKHCITLRSCDNVEGSEIESYESEKEVLLAWQRLVQKENPDIIIGYNRFAFDDWFLFKRAEENGCNEDFLKLSKNKDEICGTYDKQNKMKIESKEIKIASGTHTFHFFKMNGRVQIDLYNYFRRTENFSSYKLDYVAGHYIGDYVKSISYHNDCTEIETENTIGLTEGSFVHFEEISHSVEKYNQNAKFKVIHVLKNKKIVLEKKITPDMTKKVRWCLAKDDVSPKDIFRLFNGSSIDRSIIAKYCIQDCNLVHYLFLKIDALTGYIEMSNICHVPISFLIQRGQGIKLTSFLSKECYQKNILIPELDKKEDDSGYEGAIVLEPKCDLYIHDPIGIGDFNSLYPSCMISENLCHTTKIYTKTFDLKGNLIKETGEKDKYGNYIYDNLPGLHYKNIEYDVFSYLPNPNGISIKKIKTKTGMKICRFIQSNNGKEKGILPSMLEILLDKRKKTRKYLGEVDETFRNVLNQRQLGYKVTANSLYGNCGAPTSAFYEKDIASCTTSTGRKLLLFSKKIIETCFINKVYSTKYGDVITNPEYIYGDTDSIFLHFHLKTLEHKEIEGKKALEITIELTQMVTKLISSFLEYPHKLEYEKTFMPFCLLAKKKYVGILYEMDANKGKRKEMGIVLKRRDNAPIVKDIYGGVIDILMKEQNIHLAISFLKDALQKIVNKTTSIDKLIITKSLSSDYKNPDSISHKVLADRMISREPGLIISSGDRIPYVFIYVKNKNALQGEKIEEPNFVMQNKLNIDYSYYISNQIMNPLLQLFSLIVNQLWTKKSEEETFNSKMKSIYHKYHDNHEKIQKKITELKNEEVKRILFDPFLIQTNLQNTKNQDIQKFFLKKTS
jgi:DNA polymerase elongation subunit (family B)